MAKQIIFGEEARHALKKGIDTLAEAVRVIVTTVSLVRTTAPTTSLSRTSVFHPVTSDIFELSPSMMAWRCASKFAPTVTHRSPVSVRMIVSPPATMSDSVAVGVTLPVTTTRGTVSTVKVGVATISGPLFGTKALAGTVTVIVS